MYPVLRSPHSCQAVCGPEQSGAGPPPHAAGAAANGIISSICLAILACGELGAAAGELGLYGVVHISKPTVK